MEVVLYGYLSSSKLRSQILLRRPATFNGLDPRVIYLRKFSSSQLQEGWHKIHCLRDSCKNPGNWDSSRFKTKEFHESHKENLYQNNICVHNTRRVSGAREYITSQCRISKSPGQGKAIEARTCCRADSGRLMYSIAEKYDAKWRFLRTTKIVFTC